MGDETKHEIGAVGCGCGWHPSCVADDEPMWDDWGNPLNDAAERSEYIGCTEDCPEDCMADHHGES